MKKNFVFLMVQGLAFLLCGIAYAEINQGNAKDVTGSFSAITYYDPVVNINANGSDGPIELGPDETLNITISLNAEDHENEAADWWVLQVTPEALFYFDVKTLSMVENEGDFTPTLQVGLVSFEEVLILSLSGLQEGSHVFCFGVDLNMNGSLDAEPLYYDLVQVTVTDGGPESTYTNSLGQTFVLLSAGVFNMGSPEDEQLRYSDETQHQVKLTQPFYMQQTEVTQAQWQAVTGNNPSEFDGCSNCPVEDVSWNDVQGFITEMNAMGEGTYSLPTEAQWEYAARAGGKMAFANGEITESGCLNDPNLVAMGWYCYNSDDETHSVAGKTPNAWGLYDMHGNVYEWCQDWWSSAYFDSDEAAVDPTGPVSGSYRVTRGGSWWSSVGYCRSANRSSSVPDHSSGRIGFRLVRQP